MKKSVNTAIEMANELVKAGKHKEARELSFEIISSNEFNEQEIDYIVAECSKFYRENVK